MKRKKYNYFDIFIPYLIVALIGAVLVAFAIVSASLNKDKPVLTNEQLEAAYEHDNYDDWEYQILSEDDILRIYQQGVKDGKSEAEIDYDEKKEYLIWSSAYAAWLNGYEEGYSDAYYGLPYEEGKADAYEP